MGCLEKRERFVLDQTKGTWGLLAKGSKVELRLQRKFDSAVGREIIKIRQ